jgi:hypothetical protein
MCTVLVLDCFLHLYIRIKILATVRLLGIFIYLFVYLLLISDFMWPTQSSKQGSLAQVLVNANTKLPVP